MRFALLGDHPDGLAMAGALQESGRHPVAVYFGPAAGAKALGPGALRLDDVEEVLADPAIEAVLVAGSPAERPALLRRALQSERHVLCVHPADPGVELAYEAAMIQRDTRCLLLPLLPETLHPGIQRLAGLARSDDAPVGRLRLIEMERGLPDDALGDPSGSPSLPGWDVLRLLAGEIAEVSALAAHEELKADEPLLLSGKFDDDVLFRSTFQQASEPMPWRLILAGSLGRVELLFPQGWPGPSVLSWRDASGDLHEVKWPAWDPWPPMVEAFEAALARRETWLRKRSSEAIQEAIPRPAGEEGLPPSAIQTRPGVAVPAEFRRPIAWQDEIRCLELDDAALRSIAWRRASVLEYPEANEENTFKGKMTLLGCGILWTAIVVLILSVWVPYVHWIILPILVLFLGLQVLRWIIPKQEKEV